LDELEYEREIAARVIRSLNLQPSVFEGLPAMSKDLEDAYLDEVRSCDLFVLVVWKSLRPPVLREYEEATRANRPVLIFVKLAREYEKRERKLATFLGKIRRMTQAEANQACVRFYKHYRTLEDFEVELKKGIIEEIERRLSESVKVTTTRQGLYELGTSIVELARQRLCILQRTPSFFFESKGFYEEEFRNALAGWIEKARQDPERELIYLYRANKTSEEIAKSADGQALVRHIKETIATYKHIELETKGRLRFSSLPPNYQGPIFAVGDDRFAIWFTGEDQATAISYTNAKLSDCFADLFRELASRTTTEGDLLTELGLL
jgi:hypothetical protein